MAQDTRGDLAVTRLNPWLSYALYLPYETHTKNLVTAVGGRLEIEVQLMEVDAAARSPPHKLVQEHRLQERSARHLVGWIALGLVAATFRRRPDHVRRRYRRRDHRPSTTSTPALCSESSWK